MKYLIEDEEKTDYLQSIKGEKYEKEERTQR